MSPSATVYDVISLSFNGTEHLLGSVRSEAEANRLLAELAAANRQPSTYFNWVARPAKA
jgi:hypothetical protein